MGASLRQRGPTRAPARDKRSAVKAHWVLMGPMWFRLAPSRLTWTKCGLARLTGASGPSGAPHGCAYLVPRGLVWGPPRPSETKWGLVGLIGKSCHSGAQWGPNGPTVAQGAQRSKWAWAQHKANRSSYIVYRRGEALHTLHMP